MTRDAGTQRKRVLFLCTENSARSQMAEALLRSITHGKMDAYSASTEPRALHPLAIKAMAEAGIDEGEQLVGFRRIRIELRHRLDRFGLANKLAPELRPT